MDICEKGLSLLYSFEGKHKLLSDGRYKAYLDTIAVPNIPTIYAGLTKGVTMDMVVTEEEGERMLRKELAVTEDAIERLVTVPLNQHQFSALTVLVYNIGVGGFASSTLLRLLNQGKYEQVPAQMTRWVHAGGKRINGLVRRRSAEAALFMEPMPIKAAGRVGEADEVDQPDAPQMPQRVEEAPAGKATDAIRQSWTIRGGVMAFFAVAADTITDAYDWLFGVAKDAGTELGTIKQAVGPFDSVLLTVKSALPILAVIGIVIIVSRRIQAAKEGKIG